MGSSRRSLLAGKRRQCRGAGFGFFIAPTTRIKSSVSFMCSLGSSRARSGGKFGSLWTRPRTPSYNPDTLAPPAAQGCPDGTKKARVARDTAPVAERLQASIEQCVANTKSSAAKREKKSDARWSALMVNRHVKLDLLRTNVAVKKRNTDLAFLLGADTSTMDEQVKVWNHADDPIRNHADDPDRNHADDPIRNHADDPDRNHADDPNRNHTDNEPDNPGQSRQRSRSFDSFYPFLLIAELLGVLIAELWHADRRLVA
ncbi:putative methionyl-tRNA synthetase [Hordeum vulgare]|nr:putative methionyl-tRNA synthetase [Hordeum vulgare]